MTALSAARARIVPLLIDTPVGPVHSRPETPSDADFLYALFCVSRPPDWDPLRGHPAIFEQLMRQQFEAQAAQYGQRFPNASFEVVELEGERVGRVVVDRSGTGLHVVDIAIVPMLRGRGIGTAVLRALLAEAEAAGLPVHLSVASSNDRSLRLYLRLGFVVTAKQTAYLTLERRPRAAGS
jgi:ribosomal protein S18 acetylase RimI-like enzyme